MPKRDWRTKPDKPGKVKITRPDPETGEVIEMTRAESTLKANARGARREGEPSNLLQITGRERRELIAGRIDRLIRKTKVEGVEEGYHYIVDWDRPKPFADPEDGTVFTPEARPACWITVTAINLAKGKGWAYVLRVERQEKTDPALRMKRGAGYTTDPAQAIDEVEAELSSADRNRISAEARQAYAEQRQRKDETRERDARTDAKRLGARIRDVSVRCARLGADPTPLIAQIEGLLREQERRFKDAA